jgi:hypothetical protein
VTSLSVLAFRELPAAGLAWVGLLSPALSQDVSCANVFLVKDLSGEEVMTAGSAPGPGQPLCEQNLLSEE